MAVGLAIKFSYFYRNIALEVGLLFLILIQMKDSKINYILRS